MIWYDKISVYGPVPSASRAVARKLRVHGPMGPAKLSTCKNCPYATKNTLHNQCTTEHKKVPARNQFLGNILRVVVVVCQVSANYTT